MRQDHCLEGATISGLIGILTVSVREFQITRRRAKVFYHSWCNTEILKKYEREHPTSLNFPVILVNECLPPGRWIYCSFRISPLVGLFFMHYDGWGDVTAVNTGKTNEKVYQRLLDSPVYPNVEPSGSEANPVQN